MSKRPDQPPGVPVRAGVRQRPVWFATQQRMDSRTKMVVMDDRGTLAIEKGQVSFQGRRWSVSAKAPFDVSLARPVFPIYSSLAILALVATLAIVLFTIDPTAGIGMAIGVGFGILGGILVNRRQQFVRIAEQDGDQVLYVYSAKGFGWDGILRGNQRLVEEVAACG